MEILIFINILILILILIYSTFKKYYTLIVFMVIFIGYELTGPIFNFILPEGYLSDYVLLPINGYSYEYLLILILIQVFIFISFIFFEKKVIKQKNKINWSVAGILFLWIFVIFCGFIGFYDGAGLKRLDDYIGSDNYVTPFFSYGILLLPMIAISSISLFKNKKYLPLFLGILMLYPLMYEIFLTSRRQFFAPILLLLLFYILYSNIPKKWLILFSFFMISLLILGAQFFVRTQFNLSESNYSLIGSTMGPQLGEFSAINAISYGAWEMFVTDSATLTYGFHLIYKALNSIPFLNLGDILYPNYSLSIEDVYRSLAPWGGWSMLADSFMAFGILGIIFFSVTTGIFLRIAHKHLRLLFSRDDLILTGGSTYFISLASILILKYRSGYGDLIKVSISFTILFFLILYSGNALYYLFRTRNI